MLPWHSHHFTQLMSKKDNFPQSLLIYGPQGIGKVNFAHTLIQLLLCDAPLSDNLPCGSCQSCHWLAQKQHPDLITLSVDKSSTEESEEKTLEEKNKEKKTHYITIDAVRELSSFLTIGAQRQGYKIIFIEQADALNINAANALLKALEEPPNNMLFILVANDIKKILPTILSRCQKLQLNQPNAQDAYDYLHIPQHEADYLLSVYGTPLSLTRAIDQGTEELRKPYLTLLNKTQVELLELSELAQKIPIEYWLDWTHKWCIDLLAQHFTQKKWFHKDAEFKSKPLDNLILFDLLHWEHQLKNAKKYQFHPLVAKLFIEDLLIPWLPINRYLY
ncbi:AAA family ATPase [Ferrovum sp. PN-J185]|uniref:AAA family ATPase n=1 Tax=Ferrovum sp. PN-J185 TaxID=1356306 RepID=UPI00079AD846|nr:AAA family ATPase [Ferrovum sp. PN-J185]KXW56785.1 DNA polymerase III subunit tau [Ferrovum sp. PN-J185]